MKYIFIVLAIFSSIAFSSYQNNFTGTSTATIDVTPLASDATVNQYYYNNGVLTFKAPDKFFLIIGQSNAVGKGTFDASLDTTDSDAYMLNADLELVTASEPIYNFNLTPTAGTTSFGLAFAREYLDNNSGETIALVKAAKDGTSLGSGEWQQGGTEYVKAVAAANKLVAMGSTFAGMLWHQGESDATTSYSGSYETNLIQMVADLRSDITGSNSQVPFLGGTLADDNIAGDSAGFPNANRNEVNDALINIPFAIDYANTVDLSGLDTDDNVHFNAAALRTAGVRYYNALVNSNSTTVKTPSFTGVLDTYTTAAAAYSLRKLRSAYSGSAVRVRRVSDDSESDIGFVESGDDYILDTSTMETFCASTDCHVTTWYDQSGNSNDATQATSTAQPKIVSSGTTLTVNSKPAVQGDGNDYLDTGYYIPNTSTVFGVIQGGGANKVMFGAWDTSNPGGDYAIFQGGSAIYYDFGYGSSLFASPVSTITLSTQAVYYAVYDGTALDFSVNGETEVTKTPGSITEADPTSGATAFIFAVNANGSMSINENGYAQEIIVYASDKTSDKTNITTALNTFYGAY